MAIQKSGEGSSNLEPQSLRDVRLGQRVNYTDACVEKGADANGIRLGTNRIYDTLFGNRPTGNRDSWPEDQQKEIAVGEHFAANHIRGLPTPEEGSSQRAANNAVVKASGEGAQAAREYIDDQADNGNFWTRLF